MNSFECGACRRDRGHVRDLRFNRRFPQIAVVVDAFFSGRRVDDQVDLTVGNHIQDIRTSFIQLVYPLRRDSRLLDQSAGLSRRHNPEPAVRKSSGDLHHFRFVSAVHRYQHSPAKRQLRLGRLLSLEKRFPVVRRKSQDFSGGTHFRSQDRIHLREHIKWEYGFLYAIIWNILLFQPRYRRWSSGQLRCNNIYCQRHHADVADFGNQRNRTGRPGIGFQHVHFSVLNRVLHVHEASDMHFLSDLPRVFFDRLHIFCGNMHRRNDARGISRMDPCQLDMFHHGRDERMRAVADGIRLALQRMVQESVDQDRTVRRHAHGCLHVFCHAFIIIDHFHAASAQYVRRTHHHRISDSSGDRQRFVHRRRHAGFGHGDLQLFHHLPEQIPILRQINDGGRRSQNLDTVFLQFRSQVQRGLPSELCNHTHRLLFLINTQHVFQCQRLKIQFVRSIIIGGYRLRIAVHDDRFKSQFFQGQRRMDTAVVELDALPDPVGASAQNHDFRFVGADRILVRSVVSGIIICAVRRPAHMDAFPVFFHSDGDAALPYLILRDLQNPAQIFIRKSVLFGCRKHLVRGKSAFVFKQCFFLFYQFFHLLDEPDFYLGQLMDLFHRRPLAQRLVHDKMTVAARRDQKTQQILLRHFMIIPGIAQTVASRFQTAHRFLERFLICFSDTHDFADRTHLCSQLVFHAFKFFKCPAGKFDHHIVAVRHIFVQCAVFSAGDVLQRQPRRQHRRYQRDRESRCL